MTAFTISAAGLCGSGDPLVGDVTQDWGFPGSSQSQGVLGTLPGSEAGPRGRQEPCGVMAPLPALSMGRAQKALGRRDESGTRCLDPATPLWKCGCDVQRENSGSGQILRGRYTRETPAQQEVWPPEQGAVSHYISLLKSCNMGLFTSRQPSDMQDLLFKEEFHSLFVGLQAYIPVKFYHLLPIPSQLCFSSYFFPMCFHEKSREENERKKEMGNMKSGRPVGGKVVFLLLIRKCSAEQGKKIPTEIWEYFTFKFTTADKTTLHISCTHW